MDNYSGESEFIESLDFLSPPVRRIHSSKQAFGNAYNSGTNNVHLLRGFRNKLIRRTPFCSKHVKTNYSESSTSLILKKTSERQILEQCSIVSFASLPQPEVEIGSGIKADKNPNTSEKPLIKVTVIPKTDQVKAAKLLRRRRYIPKIVQSTTSNHENSIHTKNLYLIVAGRRREKIYEIKTTGSAKLSTDHDSNSKNEELPISQLSNFKHLIQSLNMDRKKKKEKLAPSPGEHSDAQEHLECKCLPNYESSNVSKEAPKKSRVRIFGRLGISEDDKYVLRYGATVNDKQVMSDVAQITSDFSPIIAETSYGIAEEEPEHLQDSCLQAAHNYDLDMEKPPVTDIISKESQGTQVNFNVEFASASQGRYATVSNKKIQCSCCDNRSDHNALKDCQSPLVIISVYPKQSPENLLQSDHSAGVNTRSWSPAAADVNTYTSNQIIRSDKVLNKSDTRRNYKNPLMSRSTSPVRKTSRSKVADELLKAQISERRSPDRQKALRAIKEKIREKDKLKLDASSRKLPMKLNTTNATQASKNFQNLTVSNATQVSKRNQRVCDVALVTQASIKSNQHSSMANGTQFSGIQNNTVSNATQYANEVDSLTASNAIQYEDNVDSLQKIITSPKFPRHKPMKHLRTQVSKATQVPKVSQLFSNHATQASMNDPVKISDATQISKNLPSFITSRVKNQETFAKPAHVFKSDQTTRYPTKARADTGTNTDHAKTKKALVDTYTKKLTEKMNQRDYIPPKYVNSKVTINIDGDREYYDVLFNQNNLSTDLTIRKKVKDVGSQKCVEPTLGSLLCLPDCAVDRGGFMTGTGSKSPTKCPSILLYNNLSEDGSPLVKHVSRLTIRDSLEICHRREDKTSNNIKNTQTCFMTQVADNDINETEFLAPIKHFTGDDCSICDPIERDKQIRELLGVNKVKTNYTKINQGRFCKTNDGNPYRCIYRQECKTSQVTEINFRFQEVRSRAGQAVHTEDKATLSVQCQRGYPKLKECGRKPMRHTSFPKDEKVGSFVKYSADGSKKKECTVFKNEQSAIYQQLILNKNIQVFLQLEQFSKQKPIILSRKQYDKVKKTIQKTISTKKSAHEKRKPLNYCAKRESSEVSVGEVRTKKVKDPKSNRGKAKKQRGRTSTATTQEPQCGIAQTDDILGSTETCKHPSKIGETGGFRRQAANTDTPRCDSPDKNLDRGDAKLKKSTKDKNNEARSIIEPQNINKHRLQIVTERDVGVGGERVDRCVEHLSSIQESFDHSSKKVQAPDLKRRDSANKNEDRFQKKEGEVETYVLFNAEKPRENPKNIQKKTKETECEDARKTMSSVEIRYASVAFMKQVAYSSTDVGALSDSSLGHLNSFHTLFRGHRKCATPNLGTSAYSLYSEDGYKYNLQNKCAQIEPQDSKPKKPFLRRLMSCLVMRSTKVSALKLPNTPQSDLPSVNSSLDSYHISTSLGAMEVSSSIYDTSASFYSNHTILPVNTKIKRGFFSSVRGFLTNRKS